MDLERAIKVLNIEKGVAELDISNGQGNQRTQDFVDAVNIIFSFIYDVIQIDKIGKKD